MSVKGSENEGVNDEVDDVVLVVDMDVQDEVNVYVVDECAKDVILIVDVDVQDEVDVNVVDECAKDVDAKVAVDVHVEDVVDDVV